jgi:serine/threonine-protein kinase
MADVFLASPPGSVSREELVAIKRIRPDLVEDASFVSMFLDEASITRQLNHPNIACLLDWGEQDGVPYLVMEFVKGVSVRMLLTSSALPQHIAAEIGAEVACALHVAHEQRGPDGERLGIVHRDVTPHNVMVTFEGQVKLLDFGIALARVRAERTRTGVLKGKWAYMSPEQVAGLELDHRSDIFSLGSLLHEMLTGTRAFDGESPAEVLMRIMRSESAPLEELVPDIDPGLLTVLHRCHEKGRDERYQSAADVARALHTVRQQMVASDPRRGSLSAYLGNNFAYRQVQIDKALSQLEDRFQPDAGLERDSQTMVQEAPFLELSGDLEALTSEETPGSQPGERIPELAPIEPAHRDTALTWLVPVAVLLGLALGLGVIVLVWYFTSATPDM